MRAAVAVFGVACAALSGSALCEDRCRLEAVLGDKPVTLEHCAVALYDSEHSVTLVFSEKPLDEEELKAFRISSYAGERDPGGRLRTMMHFGFCPGGGKPAPDPAAVKTIEVGASHASSPMLGRQWVFELPKDRELLKVESLSGDLAPGGRLKGRITGRRKSDDATYRWEADFDVALPAKSAAAGNGCGS